MINFQTAFLRANTYSFVIKMKFQLWYKRMNVWGSAIQNDTKQHQFDLKKVIIYGKKTQLTSNKKTVAFLFLSFTPFKIS